MKYLNITNTILLALTLFLLWRGPRTEPAVAPQKPAIEAVDSLDDWRRLIMAIAFTESKFNASALGATGDTGILQIREIYVNEVNRLYGTDYIIQDALDPAKSIELFRLMQEHYNPSKGVTLGVRYHNKSPYYAVTVRQNMELIRRYEEFRKLLINTEL